MNKIKSAAYKTNEMASNVTKLMGRKQNIFHDVSTWTHIIFTFAASCAPLLTQIL